MNNPSSRPGLARRAVFAGLAFAVAASAAAFAPAAAYADDQAVIDEWSEIAAQQLNDEDFQAYTSDGLDAELVAQGQSADRVDLREQGFVTPVKNQSPWNTCWAFAAISASETSILSSAKAQGKTLSNFDLSELQLSALVYSYNGVPESVAGKDQAGEGYYSTCKNPNDGINTGGSLTYASAAFAAGIGPVAESDAEYKNNDDAIVYLISGDRIGEAFEGATGPVKFTKPSESELDEWRNKYGLTCVPVCYAGTYWWSADKIDSKEYFADWSVSQDLWQKSLYELTDGNLLPETRILVNGECTGTDLAAVAAIKSELKAGRAVATSMYADTSTPGAAVDPTATTYINMTTWAQYTYETKAMNHGVTIVGYDDSFSRANFSDDEGKQPAGDGAWIVKNSMGSQTEDFPNCQGYTPDWGIVDEDGKHTGYFYVSYYDKSISGFESFEFDLSQENVGASTGRIIDQYDYMPVNGTTYGAFTGKVSGANIFKADADMAVRALWCETTVPNSTVTFDVYLLDDDAADPTDAEHSRKVFSASATYDYGGYHRYAIDEDEWICMRAGQRYSVVVTQAHQNSAGAWVYTQPVNYNTGVKELQDLDYNDDGTTKVVDSWDAGFVAKVNPEESWVTSSVDDWTTDDAETAGGGSWTDWSLVTTALNKKNKASNIIFDNLPIKAYAQAQSWASVDELASLEEKIAAAKALLGSVAISKDGTDVAAGKQWLTRADHDALAAALASAQDTLALAGADYRTAVVSTTPTSDDVKAAVDALGIEAKAGLKQEAKQAGAQAAAGSAKKRVPATGDAAALAAVPAAAGATLLALRRRFAR